MTVWDCNEFDHYRVRVLTNLLLTSILVHSILSYRRRIHLTGHSCHVGQSAMLSSYHIIVIYIYPSIPFQKSSLKNSIFWGFWIFQGFSEFLDFWHHSGFGGPQGSLGVPRTPGPPGEPEGAISSKKIRFGQNLL